MRIEHYHSFPPLVCIDPVTDDYGNLISLVAEFSAWKPAVKDWADPFDAAWRFALSAGAIPAVSEGEAH